MLAWKCVVFFVAATTTTSVRSLQCYSCDSRSDQGCASPLNASLIKPFECSSAADTCVAYTAIAAGNVTYTIRDCTTFISGQPCDVFKDNVENRNETFKSCYSCQKDHCNSSDGLKGAAALLALTFLVQFFVNH